MGSTRPLASARQGSECARFSGLLAAAVAGCATAPPPQPVVWPEAPEVPRIRFVRAFRGTDDLRPEPFQRFLRSVFGDPHDPKLSQPMGIAVSDDGLRLYVADLGLGHVLKVDLEEERVDYFAPDEGMGKPFAVALDANENVYVTDSSGGGVRVFDLDGELLKTIAASHLERATGIALDRKLRRIYVADASGLKSSNHRVRAFDLDGRFLFDVGPKESPPARGDRDGELFFPTFLSLGPDHHLYVVDTMNFRIQVFDAAGKFVRKFGEHGDTPGTFSRLKGIAFDGFGNLYVVDGGHSNVQIFNEHFDPLMYFGGYAPKLEFFDVPSGIAIDPRTNMIYVANQFIARVNQYELINTRPEDSVPPPVPEDVATSTISGS
ncbi:MAG: SMP-30/gluconolactonase/LRE family protein [Deltaproteobacteria bacterium]|nr:SMP-30/gluconolactonase/LRE family protein [Deltaproteobacteria bacterium]